MLYRITAAIAAIMLSSTALADCDVSINVGDGLAFDTDAIEVPASCETVTVTISHSGKLPSTAMGHNWVLATDADWQEVAQAGMSAGFEGSFVPEDDERVIAATKLVGGGESDKITFSTKGLKTDGAYTFFCSFPGHWSVMKGSFKLV